MSERNLVIITKIILFYSIFFVGMKLFIIFQGAWLVPNLLLSVPFVVLAILSGVMVKSNSYSWVFVGIGAAVIILIRIFESRLAYWIQQQVQNF